MLGNLWEPIRAYWARKRLERLHCEAAAAVLGEVNSTSGPMRVAEEPDIDDWRLLASLGGRHDDADRETLRHKARHLADNNPYARNILHLLRDYVVGGGMKHEVVWRQGADAAGFAFRRKEPAEAGTASESVADAAGLLSIAAMLWNEFLDANEWHTGNRKDWEFCVRVWRDGECFLRLFRPADWPPRIHFIDPESVAADPQTGWPSGGIETEPDNVELPIAYHVAVDGEGPSLTLPARVRERVPADRILHVKIGVDGNVKRGRSLFQPVLEQLKRFQGWLEVELIHRKLASSIVLVRKHQQNYPSGLTAFADASAASSWPGENAPAADGVRRTRILPGSIIDAQGFDLQFLSPDSHFADASILGRMILLSVAAGAGLPEFMLTADASNANYASTLVAEAPAVRHFSAWQAFFIGQWRKLFRRVMGDAAALGFLPAAAIPRLDLRITPPPLAVRNRQQEAQADAIYFDRGALSALELARRDGVDPEQMRREREKETPSPQPSPPGRGQG